MSVRKKTFKDKLLSYIRNRGDAVILRSDMDSMGAARQVSRGLKALVEDGELVKLGYGVYAKADQSDCLARPVISIGFTEACIEVLRRFGVQWEPSQAISDYNEGRSQQVPARFEVRLKSRFRRKLSYGHRSLRVEGMIYAR